MIYFDENDHKVYNEDFHTFNEMLGEHVRFEGVQPHDRLPAYYGASDVTVVCSHSESFGLTALEAHACGAPVVATAVGGLSQVVKNGHSGWLLAERDPSRFAAGSESCLRTIASSAASQTPRSTRRGHSHGSEPAPRSLSYTTVS